MMSIIARINAKLPIDKRIMVVDISENPFHPLIKALRDSFIQYGSYPPTPYLYLDGIAIIGITTEEFAEGLLEGYLKKEFIIK